VISEHRRRHDLVGGGAVPVEEPGHQRRAVHGQSQGAANAEIVERRHPCVQSQVADHQASLADHLHPRRGVRGERGGDVGHHTRRDIHLAVPDERFHFGSRVEPDKPGGVKGGQLAPVTVVGGHADFPSGNLLYEAVRTGSHRLPGESVCADPLEKLPGQDEDGAQFLQQDGMRSCGHNPDRVVAFAADGGDGGAVAAQGGSRVVPGAQDGKDHVVGAQRRAVVKRHAPAQAEQPGEGVGILPARRQQGHQLHVAVEAGQTFEQVGLHQEREVLRLRVGHQRERHAAQGDHHLGFMRRRRGAARAQPGQRQQRQSAPATRDGCRHSTHGPIPAAGKHWARKMC